MTHARSHPSPHEVHFPPPDPQDPRSRTSRPSRDARFSHPDFFARTPSLLRTPNDHHYDPTRTVFQLIQLHIQATQSAPLSRGNTPAAPSPSDSVPGRGEDGKGGTHRLRVQAGRSPGSAASPRPPQSTESPAQVQAAAQGARGPAAANAGSSRSSTSSSSSQWRRRQGERRGAPSARRTGRAILSGARSELPALGLRGPGRPQARAGQRGLRSALGSAPGHGRRHKFSLRRRLRRSAGPRCPSRSAAPGGGREPHVHPGRPARARCEPHGSGQRVLGRHSSFSRRAPGRASESPCTPSAAAAARKALRLAAGALRPWASSSPLRASSCRLRAGRRGQPRTAPKTRCASLSQRRRQSARTQLRAPHGSSALREPRTLRNRTINR